MCRYYKEVKLKKKIVCKEEVPIQQTGRYYLVIETGDKVPKNRHFSCHFTLTRGESILKESFNNGKSSFLFFILIIIFIDIKMPKQKYAKILQ